MSGPVQITPGGVPCPTRPNPPNYRNSSVRCCLTCVEMIPELDLNEHAIAWKCERHGRVSPYMLCNDFLEGRR